VKYFLFGKAGTGKDLVASLALNEFGIDSVALADPIREEYTKYFERTDYKENRNLMQLIGERYKEIYGMDVWCRRASKKVNDWQKVLIRDGRYTHEYDFFVLDHGFTPIRIVADEEVRFQRLKMRDGDIQRQSLFYEDKHFIPDTYPAITLTNNGSIDDLIHEMKKVFIQEA
jgi:dephospho-CoA kinase